MLRAVAWVFGLALALGCEAAHEPERTPAPTASRAALEDPETCKACHAEHYLEWASSMHAYAARDPVFIAMNERGQRETGGALGDFCIKCHAPMALELGLTEDGLNLPELDDPNARGVTCYFCHDVRAVTGDHNRALELAHDTTMRGGLGSGSGDVAQNRAPPHANSVHASAYSGLHDRARSTSAGLCGACHDIVNTNDVALERTFAEWRSSIANRMPGLETCGACHMDTYTGRAAAGAPERELHRHMFAGIDVALEHSFPGVDAQRAAIACKLAGAVDLELRASTNAPPFDRFEVTLRNARVGHAFPSGAAQDRRAWVELVAYDADDDIVYSRGVVADGEAVGEREPDLEVLRDTIYGADARPVHMFWQAAPSDAHPNGYESTVLPPRGKGAAAERTFTFQSPVPAARVTARLRVQSIGLDVLDDFAGIELPITERVLNNVYQNAPTLRSLVPTVTVPGTERELVLNADGAMQPAAETDATDPGCAAQSYVTRLKAE